MTSGLETFLKGKGAPRNALSEMEPRERVFEALRASPLSTLADIARKTGLPPKRVLELMDGFDGGDRYAVIVIDPATYARTLEETEAHYVGLSHHHLFEREKARSVFKKCAAQGAVDLL